MSIIIQMATTRDATIVVPISRFGEREPTISPVRKPETQKAAAFNINSVTMNRVSYLVGLIQRKTCTDRAEKRGTNIHLHNTTPAIKTPILFMVNLILLATTLDIVPPFLVTKKARTYHLLQCTSLHIGAT